MINFLKFYLTTEAGYLNQVHAMVSSDESHVHDHWNLLIGRSGNRQSKSLNSKFLGK